jgi:Xaa-Pro aminopeptidase
MTGITLPFQESYPERQAAAIMPLEGDTCAVVVPPDWVQSVRDQGWRETLLSYDEAHGLHPHSLIETLGKALTSLSLSNLTLGYDSKRVSAGLVETFRASTKAKLIPVDKLLFDNRAMKSPAEVALIEKSCEYADRGIIHALNHLEGTLWGPGYTVPEFAERIRVHLFESGGSGVGNLAVTVGDDTQLLYSPHRGNIEEGLLIRSDITSHSMGYWSSLSRLAYTGYPPSEIEDAYYENQMLKDFTVDLLKPGVRGEKLFNAVHNQATKMGTRLHGDVVGYGVGCSQSEAPILGEGSKDVVRNGNVVSLGVSTLGPRKEVLVDRDVYEVKPDGVRKLSWYRSWKEIYAVTGFRAVH